MHRSVLTPRLTSNELNTNLGFNCARIEALKNILTKTQADNSITCKVDRSCIKISIAATEPRQLDKIIINGIYAMYNSLKSLRNFEYIMLFFLYTQRYA